MAELTENKHTKTIPLDIDKIEKTHVGEVQEHPNHDSIYAGNSSKSFQLETQQP